MADAELRFTIKEDGSITAFSARLESALTKAMRGAGGQVAQLRQGMTSALSAVGSAVRGTVSALTSLQGMLLTTAGVGGVGALALSIVKAGAEVETFKARLVGLKGSQEAANEAFAFMAELARTTPFDLPQVVQAGIQLEAFGANAESTLKAVADLAAFMGTDLVTAAQSFGRAFASGAGAADVLRERGVLNLIALKTGIQDLTELTLPEFRKAMLDAMTDPGGQIAGATTRLAGTWQGMLSNLSDNWFRMRDMIAESGLFEFIKSLLGGVMEQIEALAANGSLQRWAQEISDAIVRGFSAAAQWVGGVLPGAIGVAIDAFYALRGAAHAVLAAVGAGVTGVVDLLSRVGLASRETAEALALATGQHGRAAVESFSKIGEGWEAGTRWTDQVRGVTGWIQELAATALRTGTATAGALATAGGATRQAAQAMVADVKKVKEAFEELTKATEAAGAAWLKRLDADAQAATALRKSDLDTALVGLEEYSAARLTLEAQAAAETLRAERQLTAQRIAVAEGVAARLGAILDESHRLKLLRDQEYAAKSRTVDQELLQDKTEALRAYQGFLTTSLQAAVAAEAAAAQRIQGIMRSQAADAQAFRSLWAELADIGVDPLEKARRALARVGTDAVAGDLAEALALPLDQRIPELQRLRGVLADVAREMTTTAQAATQANTSLGGQWLPTFDLKWSDDTATRAQRQAEQAKQAILLVQGAIEQAFQEQQTAAVSAWEISRQQAAAYRAELSAVTAEIDTISGKLEQLRAQAGGAIVTKAAVDDQASAALRNILDLSAEIPREIVQRVRVQVDGSVTAANPFSGGSRDTAGGSGSGWGASDWGTSSWPSYDGGGVVPGPIGRPQPSVLHGGETVRTPEQERALAAGTTIHAPISITVNGSQEDSAILARRIAREVEHELERRRQLGTSRLRGR